VLIVHIVRACLQDNRVSQHTVRDRPTSQHRNWDFTARFGRRRQTDQPQLQSVATAVRLTIAVINGQKK